MSTPMSGSVVLLELGCVVISMAYFSMGGVIGTTLC